MKVEKLKNFARKGIVDLQHFADMAVITAGGAQLIIQGETAQQGAWLVPIKALANGPFLLPESVIENEYPAPVRKLSASTLIVGLTAALKATAIVASKDPGRENIACVQIQGDRVTATDGHRLHEVRLRESAPAAAINIRTEYAGLLAAAKGIGIIVDAGHARAWGDTWSITVPLAKDVTYPDVSQAIPGAQPPHMLWERKAALAALKGLSGRTTVRPGCIDLGNGLTRQCGIVQRDFPPVNVNPKYLRDAVSIMAPKEPIAVQLSPEVPIVLRQDGVLAVVMPMRWS